jgi:hypothetical protein
MLGYAQQAAELELHTGLLHVACCMLPAACCMLSGSSFAYCADVPQVYEAYLKETANTKHKNTKHQIPNTDINLGMAYTYSTHI